MNSVLLRDRHDEVIATPSAVFYPRANVIVGLGLGL